MLDMVSELICRGGAGWEGKESRSVAQAGVPWCAISAHCNLHFLGSETGFHYAGQAGFKLLTSGDPLASVTHACNPRSTVLKSTNSKDSCPGSDLSNSTCQLSALVQEGGAAARQLETGMWKQAQGRVGTAKFSKCPWRFGGYLLRPACQSSEWTPLGQAPIFIIKATFLGFLGD
ncbi:hypothetical protein AAY473_025088 [Plecturocebus cupreus]